MSRAGTPESRFSGTRTKIWTPSAVLQLFQEAGKKNWAKTYGLSQDKRFGLGLWSFNPANKQPDVFAVQLANLVSEALNSEDATQTLEHLLGSSAVQSAPTSEPLEQETHTTRRLLSPALKMPISYYEHWGHTKPDGLCGYRAAYRAHLCSIDKTPPTDPDLWDPAQRAAFTSWLELRADASTCDTVKQRTACAITWINSVRGFLGRKPPNADTPNSGPKFPHDLNAWFKAVWFTELALNDPWYGGPLFFGEQVQATFFDKSDSSASTNANGKWADLDPAFAFGVPTSIDRLRPQLAKPIFIVYNGSHFWLFESDKHSHTQDLEEALTNLAGKIIDLVQGQASYTEETEDNPDPPKCVTPHHRSGTPPTDALRVQGPSSLVLQPAAPLPLALLARDPLQTTLAQDPSQPPQTTAPEKAAVTTTTPISPLRPHTPTPTTTTILTHTANSTSPLAPT